MSGANLDHIIGRTLGGRYQVVSVIGSGASSEVYRATDLRLGRDVAVKQLRSGMGEDARFIRLFRSEAQLAASLAHPNILTVFDWSDDADGLDGGAYIVTELLTGGTLRHVLEAGGTLSLSQTAFLGLQATQGLAHAHDHGLVHRDIKPANLLFAADGRVALGDFGIARAVAEAAWTEPEGVLIGTARYAAPEQAAAERIDASVDVYSLVLCLVEAYTGELPLVRENALGTMIVRQKEDIPIDGSFGPLAEPLAWGGLADPAERAASSELLDGLLDACRVLPDPEPFTLIDLTERTGRGRRTTDGNGRPDGGDEPNVHINEDGELIIAGEHSDLTFGEPTPAEADGDGSGPDRAEPGDNGAALRLRPRPGPRPRPRRRPTARPRSHPPRPPRPRRRRPRRTRRLRSRPRPRSRRLGPRPRPRSRRRPDPHSVSDPTDPTSTLNDRTADGYLVRIETERRRPWGRIALGLLFLLLALGAVAIGLYLGRPQPELVTIDVGFPKTEVDDLRALTVDEVRSGATDGNWTVTVTERYQDGTEPGEILSQTPPPGTPLPPGAEIFIEVSLGPEIRAVPELIGLPLADARTAITGANLAVGTVSETNDEQVAAGVVMEARVDGATVEPGAEFVTDTPVDLLVSAGPLPRIVPAVGA